MRFRSFFTLHVFHICKKFSTFSNYWSIFICFEFDDLNSIIFFLFIDHILFLCKKGIPFCSFFNLKIETKELSEYSTMKFLLVQIEKRVKCFKLNFIGLRYFHWKLFLLSYKTQLFKNNQRKIIQNVFF